MTCYVRRGNHSPRSTSVRSTKGVSVPENPTASHEFGKMHEIELSSFNVLARFGLLTIVHLSPLDPKISVRLLDTGPYDPIAMHKCEAPQATALRKFSPPILGLESNDHLVPFQEMTSDVAPLAAWSEPTAEHAEWDVQDME